MVTSRQHELRGAPVTFTVSLSAFQAWQRCQQQYEYSYVRKLRLKVKEIAPQRGTLIHEYLEAYYKCLWEFEKSTAEYAHDSAINYLTQHNEGKIKAAIQTALAVGLDDLAEEYSELLPSVLRIIDHYYATRGKDDAERYEIIDVERDLTVPLALGIQSRSVIDLIVREKDRGLVLLVEHKSTANVPDSRIRLRDFQTLLYAEALSRFDIAIDGVLWNYIRTKEPTVPQVLKKGGITRRADIDTTWDVYKAAIEEASLNPLDYEEMRDRLEGREKTVFFPRFEHVIVADPAMLMEDYVQEAMRMRTATFLWEQGQSRPIRSLQRDCTFCAFYRLCEATITGGDADDLIPMYYDVRGGNGDGSSTSSSSADEKRSA